MKRSVNTLLTAIAAIVLSACGSKPTAKISNGQVDNLRSHEVTTLVKADTRRNKVKEVQTNYKPIFKLTAIKGQTIEIKGVEALEVNVPLDVGILLAEQADVQSEGVQLADKAVQFGEKVVAPVAKALVVGAVLQRQSDNAKETAIAQSAERTAQTEAMAGLASEGMGHASKPPLVLQVPMGSSVINGGSETPVAE